MKKYFLIVLLLVYAQTAFAQDIIFTINQSEYYFAVNEPATIMVEINNSYDERITGQLSYTISQEINQANYHYSNTNSQSQTFAVEPGVNPATFGFGTSDTPMTLSADLSFAYSDKVVDINNLKIHFVESESQKQNQENKQESKSEEAKQKEEEALNQKVQEMQEQINNAQNQQQSVQNNQLPQDSSALKQSMQKQLEEQKKTEEQFQENLAKNEKFQEQHQELLEQGYKQSDGKLDPKNETTGEFEINYEKDGETASLKGSMENNEIAEMTKKTSEDDKQVMEKLKQNRQYQKFDSELSKEGFNSTKPIIEKKGNMTSVEVPYINEKNQTATIKATIENEEIIEVTLEKDKSYRWILIVILIMVLSYLLYLKYYRKEETVPKKITEKPINFRKNAIKKLEEAKRLFGQGKEKDAYGKAAEAIRYYYSYKLDIRTELTNLKLVKTLKKQKIEHEQTKKCLNLCGLVEFAKYKANKKDFDEIILLGEKIIK
ncbi:MAG: hypothetical protein ABIC04_00690 [Nanoarchaeota archaeon]